MGALLVWQVMSLSVSHHVSISHYRLLQMLLAFKSCLICMSEFKGVYNPLVPRRINSLILYGHIFSEKNIYKADLFHGHINQPHNQLITTSVPASEVLMKPQTNQ